MIIDEIHPKEAYIEMTFNEEFEILQKEAEKIFATEEQEEESPFVNCVIRRALRCIKKLQTEYRDAEEQGLLVILPVMPGETVYLIDNNTDACDECENFVVGYCEEYCKCNDAEYPQCAEEPLCEKQFLEVIEYKTNQKWILENKDDFGKSIFLTREEAEAALKKIQEGK